MIVREKTQAKTILGESNYVKNIFYNNFRKGLFYWIDVFKLVKIFLTAYDKEELKKRGCRFNLGLKKWYLPVGGRASFDKFTKWWPESLKQFVFSEKFVIQQFIGGDNIVNVVI